MVDVLRLKSHMVLKGYSQGALVAEMNARGVKISENTLSSKMTGTSKWYCDDAEVICDILGITDDTEKAKIFLA